jgi:hypothetical protein
MSERRSDLINTINRGARFLPELGPCPPGAGHHVGDTCHCYGTTCVEIAGAQVYVYLDDEGVLVVNVDNETSELFVGDERRDRAVRVKLDDVVVVEPRWAGSCWCIYRETPDGGRELVHRDESCDSNTH